MTSEGQWRGGRREQPADNDEIGTFRVLCDGKGQLHPRPPFLSRARGEEKGGNRSGDGTNRSASSGSFRRDVRRDGRSRARQVGI